MTKKLTVGDRGVGERLPLSWVFNIHSTLIKILEIFQSFNLLISLQNIHIFMVQHKPKTKRISTIDQFGRRKVRRRQLVDASESMPSEEIKSIVVRSLGNTKWEYRTALGIAKENRIAVNVVEETLKTLGEVRVSVGKTVNGKKLYTLKSKKSFLGDVLTTIRSINSLKY
ncbi:MAG: hypothetical protein PHP53_15265 [Prolixibacteraceae bacterium]|nr:hypothetical protein [Prolixibacteraceae bacterium]